MFTVPHRARRAVGTVATVIILVVVAWWWIRPWYEHRQLTRDIGVALSGLTDVMAQEVAQNIHGMTEIFSRELLAQSEGDVQVVVLMPAVSDPTSSQHIRNEGGQFMSALSRHGIKSVAVQWAGCDPARHTFAAGAVAGCFRDHPEAKLCLLYRALPSQTDEAAEVVGQGRQLHALAVYGSEVKPFMAAGLVQWAVVFRYTGMPQTVPHGRESFDPAYQVVTRDDAPQLP